MLEMVRRRPRAIGIGLTAYGVTGIVAGLLVVVAAVAVGRGLEPAVASADRQRDAVVATLQSSASAVAGTTVLLEDVAGAADASGDVASQSADAARLVADTLTRVAATFEGFSVLGNRPFAPLAADARRLAAQLRGIALDLDALGISLGGIARDLPSLAVDLGTTSEQLAILATELAALAVPEAALAALRWLILGVLLLVGWLTVPAVAALAAGVVILRSSPRRSPA
jgi:hypothetical protein